LSSFRKKFGLIPFREAAPVVRPRFGTVVATDVKGVVLRLVAIVGLATLTKFEPSGDVEKTAPLLPFRTRFWID